jgi:predicted kinase
VSPQLVVIAGPERSGKMPLARKLMSSDPSLVLVHRDFLRNSFESKVSEEHITLLMADLVRGILRIQRSPIIVAWNLEKSDRDLWFGIAAEFQVGLNWLDVSLPSVAAMIPPLEVVT